MTTFEGSMVALVTPFKDGKIDEGNLKKLVEFHIENGTQVIVPCGTTGESATLTHDEHEQVISTVIGFVNKRAKVLAGAGSNSTAEAIRLHQFCQKAGADGTLHITPYYNKPTQEGLFQHFQAVAKSADLPIILYNVPSRTGVNMLAETTIRLAKIDTVVGVKEASGNLAQASMIINNTPDSFSLLSGEDDLTYPLYCLGAKGAISVTANIVPKTCVEQYLAVCEGDYKKAREIHDKLFELHKVMFIETNPIPVKAALAIMGYIEEEYRLPMVQASSQSRDKIKEVLKKMDLIF